MMPGPMPARTYGGWRRTRSIGLLGLGPTATFTMLGCIVALLVAAAVSFRALLYVAPPMVLAGVAGLIRIGGVPLAQDRSSDRSAPVCQAEPLDSRLAG